MKLNRLVLRREKRVQRRGDRVPLPDHPRVTRVRQLHEVRARRRASASPPLPRVPL